MLCCRLQGRQGTSKHSAARGPHCSWKVLSPLPLMQRLTAPIPRPRVRLLGFHDVLAPNAKTRAQAVQSVPAERAAVLQLAVCEPNCVHLRTVRIRRVQLFKRVIEVDLEHCANCGGELKITPANLKAPVIKLPLSGSEMAPSICSAFFVQRQLLAGKHCDLCFRFGSRLDCRVSELAAPKQSSRLGTPGI